MTQQYTVQQGDHLSRIAEKFAFRDERTIWNDPANAKLRTLRPNPHVLLPGDVVVIPDKEVRIEERSTEQRHTFFVRSPQLKLRIAVRDHFNRDQPGIQVDLEVDGDKRLLTTDGQGMIERPLLPSHFGGSLAALAEEPKIHIGFLDPVDSPTGWRGRLNNLGYAAGPVDRPTPLDERSALEEFQCDFGLPISGIADGATLKMLLDVHGC